MLKLRFWVRDAQRTKYRISCTSLLLSSDGIFVSIYGLVIGVVLKAPVITLSALFWILSSFVDIEHDISPNKKALYSRMGRTRDMYSQRRVQRSDPHSRPVRHFITLRRREHRFCKSSICTLKVRRLSKVKPRYLKLVTKGMICSRKCKGVCGRRCRR